MSTGDATGTTARRWSIVEYRGREGLLRLEPDWGKCSLRCDSRIPGWRTTSMCMWRSSTICRATMGGGFTCLALSDGQRIRAICPVELRTVKVLGRPMRAWTLPDGTGDSPTDVICPPDDDAERELLSRAATFLADATDCPPWLIIRRTLSDAGARRCARHLRAWPHCIDAVAPADMIDTTGAYDTVIAGFSRNFRGNLRERRVTNSQRWPACELKRRRRRRGSVPPSSVFSMWRRRDGRATREHGVPCA